MHKSPKKNILPLLFILLFLVPIILFVVSLYKLLVGDLCFLEFVDVISKLFIPTILIYLGHLLQKSYLQYSQLEKMKITSLTELNKSLYDLKDLSLEVFGPTSPLFIDNKKLRRSDEMKLLNEKIMSIYQAARSSLNSARIYLDKDFIEKIEGVFQATLDVNTSIRRWNILKDNDVIKKNTEQYESNFEVIKNGFLMQEIEKTIKSILNI